MFIRRLEVKGYKGFNFTLDFNVECNCIIGTNGSGKTTILEVLAGLCGNLAATSLIADQRVESYTLYVTGQQLSGQHVFDPAVINAFKLGLPQMANFVLREDTEDERFVLADSPALAAAKMERMVSRLESWDLALERKSHGGMVMHPMGFPSAQWYLASLYMRLPVKHAPAAPILLDYPERHLHLNLKRKLVRDLMQLGRQLIFTTHDPECLFAVSGGGDRDRYVIDLSSEKNVTRAGKAIEW